MPLEDQPTVELGPLEWQRIQLVVRLRPRRGTLDPRAVRLERVEPMPEEAISPTWSGSTDDGTVVARFNIMLGPGQRPLEPGTWTLTLAEAGGPGRPLRIDRPDIVDILLSDRIFRYRGGRYRVAPLLDPARGGALSLQIGRWRSRARRRPWRKRPRAWIRRVLKPRQRLFRALARYHRARAVRTGRRILFTSDSRSALAGNLAIIHDRMVERGLDREYELSTLFKPSISASRSWRDRWRLPRLLACADVILLDDYQPIIYRLEPDPEQRIIQVWHASGAFKTVGYSRIGKPGGPSPYTNRHKNYTYAIVSGTHDVPYYAEAFGLPEERVIPTGIPRMDRFFDEEQRARGRRLAREAFPAIEGRTTILFAPTFRGHGPRDAHYDYDRVDWVALDAVCAAKDAVVLVKMHPFISERAPIPVGARDRIIDATSSPIDVNDLLFAVNLLITDYSSIVFEYSTLLRPMLFFAYDLEEYTASRDFYVPFEDFVPGRIARTFEEVVAAIRDDAYESEKVAAFARRHFDHLDGGATDRVIDQLILRR